VNAIALEVPEAIWLATQGIFEGFARGEVEGGCLWYGRPVPERTRVELVGVPRQLNRRQNFEIPPDALAELNAAVPEDYEVVGQVHGHPGDDVHHSWWDDDLVVSRRIVSLVLPAWGARPLAIGKVGVHLFQDGAWRRLDSQGVRQALVFDGSLQDGQAPVLDLR
jgi:hypothetical protein